MHWITEDLAVAGVHDLSFAPPVGAVVNVCELMPYVPPLGMPFLHRGFPDLQPFPIETVGECVLWVDEQLRAGRKVLVHCAEGNSRSVTVVLSHMLYRGRTLENAQRLLLLKKPYVQLRGLRTSQPQYFQDGFLARWQTLLAERAALKAEAAS